MSHLEHVHDQRAADHDEVQQRNWAAVKQNIKHPGNVYQAAPQNIDLQSWHAVIICIRKGSSMDAKSCLPHHGTADESCYDNDNNPLQYLWPKA